ncbi:MAG TPA: hypothetical protein VNZ03_10525 [Terriglobales bacterium]|jgi:hypothetical protein|nr:hypothetical protein [Terriglobales bacterium]
MRSSVETSPHAPSSHTEGKFNAIAHANLVVDDAEIIANNMLAHAQLLRDFPVLQTLSH